MDGRGRLTILGPRLKGTNLFGLSANFSSLTGSIHRSGSNTSESSSHKAGFRCVRNGKVMTGVFGGTYNGGRDADEGNVGSDLGKTTPSDLVSRMLQGSGANSLIVSFNTARTVSENQ